jgi:hypothetical protein
MVAGVSLTGGGLLVVASLGACSGSSSTNATVVDSGGEASTSQKEGGEADAGVVTISCGSTTCPTSTSICCAYPPADDAGAFSYQCVVGDVCPDVDAGIPKPTALGCTSTATCTNGNVCCVRPNDLMVGPQGHISECRGMCDSDDGQLCDPSAATSGCAASAPCSSANVTSWGVPSTFGTCGGVKQM